MPAIKMEQFGGMLPAWDDHLLPNGQAASSINGYLFSGALNGWRVPKLLRNLTNSAAKFAYRVPTVTKGTAHSTLTFLANPQAGDAVTIGEFTYTFVASTASLNTPYNVLIGVASTDTAANLVAALTLDQGLNLNQGVLYGVGTGPNPALDQTGKCVASTNTVFVQAADIGAAYNSTVTTETTGSVRMSWPAATLTGGLNNSFDPSITGIATWLEFIDPDTNVLRSPIVDDQFNRYYMASPSLAPSYNTYDRIVAATPPWLLGLNPPGCAPIVSVTGGSNQSQLGLPTSISSNNFQPGANMMFVQPITPPNDQEMNDITVMPTSTSLTGQYVGVLYSDNSGKPGSLLAVGTVVVGSVSGTAIVSSFINPIAVSGTVQYWIGILTDDASLQVALADDAATVNGFIMPTTFANGPPPDFSVTSGGHGSVHVLSATATSITIDTPTALDIPNGDFLQFFVNGSLMDRTTVGDTPVGSTIIHVDFLPGDVPPPAGTLVQDITTPGAIVGGPTSGPANIPDVQMWADLTTASVVEARAYLYTWVSEYGEESAPSPTDLVNGWSNGTWSVQTFSPPPDDMGVNRNIKTIRIYRTVPGVSGQTVFYWVADIDISSNTIMAVTTAAGVLNGTVIITGPGTVADTLGDDQVALNFQLPSTNWFPPPEGLEGLNSMPNGMIVGFRANEIWFCEPYHPHAWPPAYVITTEFPIIGLGVSGMSVVACTGGTPYIATGVNPGSMSLIKVPNAEPCISRGAIIGNNSGVYYPSQKGLIQVEPASGVAVNTTELWITREKWSLLTPQKNLRAVLQSSCYFAFGTVNNGDNSVAQKGYTIELNTGDSASFTIWPQPGGHRVGFNQMTAPNAFDIQNLMNDPWTGITMLIQNGAVYYYDFTDQAPVVQPYTWTSKIYQQKAKTDFSAMRVFFTVPPNTPAQNAVRNTAPTNDPSWNTLQTGQYGIVYVFGDGVLVTTRELVSSGELLRIASGQKYEQWQWKVTGRVVISNIQAAPTVKELRAV